ncbi:MAG TPA: hypothetical protein VK177_09975 [Flavobacteriales bacterium]|nr:hypothetical protein [Flavobacteriales bacterium]
MDFEQEKNWQRVLEHIKTDVGEKPDLQSVIFLIGVQELGKGHGKFKKDEKVNLMHVAICRLLEPYGYYEFAGVDVDGWPHYEAKKQLPPLEEKEQQELMKRAIVDYFISEGIIDPQP